MAKTKPGEVCDSRGIPIYPGDLVRLNHFRERNGRRNYLYHVAVWNSDEQTMEMIPASQLEPTLSNRGGRFWLMNSTICNMGARVILGHGPGDCLDHMYRKRGRSCDVTEELDA